MNHPKQNESHSPSERKPLATSNRLASEASLYLQQHAGNPVHWQPFDERALNQAQGEDKPIFLSIGYSSCHWCHVMEREVFEHEDVAALMNRYFVSIKVDREERPDLDEIYMKATVAMTGSGGWPMSVFLTPDLKPFFAGTYFPKDMFKGLLARVHDVFSNKRSEVDGQAALIFQHLHVTVEEQDENLPSLDALTTTTKALLSMEDRQHGGIRGQQKFPMPQVWLTLLHDLRNHSDPPLEALLRRVLDAMATGGIRDHLSGGFHRYTVEPSWMIPHFEKMLYDNAQLALLYTQAFAALKDARYEEAARDTQDFMMDTMQQAEGGFAASLDADSGGEEGSTYVWNRDEFTNLLGEQHGAFLADLFGVTEEGNFEGNSVLSRRSSFDECCRNHELSLEQGRAILEKGRVTLLSHRATRVAPTLDEKIITSWNGLVIHALAHGYAVFNEPRYRTAAYRALEFIRQHHQTKEGILLRTSIQGRPGNSGVLTDYTNMIEALFAWFQLDGKEDHLRWALDLLNEVRCRFADHDTIYTSNERSESLSLPAVTDLHDSVRPSGLSTLSSLLLQASVLTGKLEFQTEAESLLRRYGSRLRQAGLDSPRLLDALRYRHRPRGEVVLLAGNDQEAFTRFHRDLLAFNHPDLLLIPLENDGIKQELLPLIPSLEGKTVLNGQTTAYLCRYGACSAPVHCMEDLLREWEAMQASAT